MRRALLVGLVCVGISAPAQAVTIQLRWPSNDPSWASLGALADGTLIRGDLLTAGVACPSPFQTQKCVTVPPPTARGTTVQYSLRACNSWSECASSNTVGLPVPGLPATPALSVDVVP